MKLIYIGDIVGGPGIQLVRQKLAGLRETYHLDLVLANAENAAGGLGLTPHLAQLLFEAGVDGITLGNHVWSKWELADWLRTEPRVARPANGAPGWPGKGYIILEQAGYTCCVLNLMGQVNLTVAASPFIKVREIMQSLQEQYHPSFFVVDFHAEATAEKVAMGRFLDGQAALVVGTHTHVQTADEQILPQGTGYITDLGMTGPGGGVIGMSLRGSLRRFVDQLPARYELADGPAFMNAVLADINPASGRCERIERLQII
ncbi:TIGR00282 family metallophosphoesterase [Oscillospiraceae bacterium HV4-5-C5C]|nr:TIGR00282 family metallophosphoesterase [Oscillospiraceae bacterium HV4-5-C5C]